MSVDYKVRQIYNVVIKEVTETQESWKSVLRLAGQIYRYEFDNVLMVYAQKPHATLVADFDTWKKVGRYVKRGSKGIAIYPSRALQPYMRMANEQLANSFRVLAGKEQVDYSKKEYAQSNVAVIRKPWEWQKKVYQNLELHLDAAIDKVDNLAKDVELQRMEKKWDELYEQTHQEGKEKVQPQALSIVSEPEYEYGADAFEAYMKGNKGEVKTEMKENTVPKTEKER